MATLHFFCGKAGAGKTTAAERLAEEHSAILLSEDIWMLRLFGDQLKSFDDYIHFSKKLKNAVGPHVVQLLKAGCDVVMDFQANTRAGRSFFRSIFEEADAAHVLHHVRTSDRVCLERITKRNNERPEGSHYLTEDDFNHISSFFQAPESDEKFNVMLRGDSDR